MPKSGFKFVCYYLPQVPVLRSTTRISSVSNAPNLHLARQKQMSVYSDMILFQSGGLWVTNDVIKARAHVGSQQSIV